MLKQKRKTIALICMILIGILGSFLFTNHSDVVYAEEFNVNANTLSVKCQLSTNAKATDDTTRMRLVSTISEEEVAKLSYVGFEIEFLADDNAKAVTMLDINNTVYAGITIDSTDAQGVSYDFTPKAFDMNSKYFSTCTISGIPQVYFDNGILIKPFVVERGLDPKVVQNREYGEHRYIKIMDVLSTNDKIMSVPVLGDASDETNVQLDGKSCTVIEKYFDGTYTHVRIAQDPKQLASVTEITVGDKPATYRNLYSTVANDTSWHEDGKGGVIVTVGDLYGFQKLSADGERFAGETVYVAQDIDLNSTWIANAEAPTNIWTPIKNFTGKFDGDGRTIRGIYVSGESQVGFFQAVLPGAKVQNFKFKNSYINATGTANTYAGAIAGIGRGSFSNIYSDATVYSTGYNVGGLVGICNDGTAEVSFTNCWNAGAVRGTSLVGGLFGYADGCKSISVSNCLNTGTICEAGVGNQVGGLCGRISAAVTTGTINNSLNTGTVYGNNANQGAIIGNDTASIANIFSNVYYLDGCCTHKGGGVISKSGVSAISASNLKSEVGYTNTSLPLDYWEYVEGGTPELRMFSEADTKLSWYLDGEGKDTFEYNIKDAAELKGFSYFSQKDNFKGDTVRLTNNVVLDTTENWTPIGSASKQFAGTFDGGNKTISGLKIDASTSWIGMFAVTTTTSEIRNFTLSNSSIKNAGSYTGSIVGLGAGKIENVKSSATVEGTSFVGGIIGSHDNGTDGLVITNCEYSGTLTTSSNNVGGLVGISKKALTISGSKFSGTLNSSAGIFNGGFVGCNDGSLEITNSESSGTITVKTDYAGGFVAQSGGNLTISNCENKGTMNVSGKRSGGFVGNSGNVCSITDSLFTGTMGLTAQYGSGFIGYSNNTVNITNSKFDGTLSTNQTDAGGFLGYQEKGTVTFTNCWSAGTITSTLASGNADLGGFVGLSGSDSVKPKTVFTSCLVSGNVNAACHFVGGYIGLSYSEVEFSDCLITGTVASSMNTANQSAFGTVWKGTVKMSDTYALNTSNANMFASYSESKVTGYPVVRSAAELTDEKAYQYTTLSETNWKFIKDAYPELIIFSTKEAATIPTNVVRIDETWYGKGTATVFTISDKEELYGLVNISKTNNFEGKTIELTNNITVGTQYSWLPIASKQYPFAGCLDGKGFEIQELSNTTAQSYFGLISYASNATVKDLSVVESEFSVINCSAGLIGEVSGNIDIQNVYIDVNINSSGLYVGGFIGLQPSGTVTISNSWNAGDVRSTYNGNPIIGGFIGQTGLGTQTELPTTSFISCLNSGKVEGVSSFIGGFVGLGYSHMTYNDCLNTGMVSSTSESTVAYPGAAFATVWTSAEVINTYALSGCKKTFHNTNKVTGYSYEFLELDESSLTGANGYFNTELSDEKWNFVEGGLPELHMHSSKTEAIKPEFRYDTSWYGDGSASTFTLSDAGDLYGFSRISQITNFAGKTILLDSNITVNSGDATTWGTDEPIYEWTPISAFGDAKEFAGTFDAQMHTISGLYRKSETRGIALFVATAGASNVKNLRIENSYFHYDGYSVQGDGYVYPGYVASVAAWGNGNFENIYSSATIVSEGNCAGGIIGAVNKYVSDDTNTYTHSVKQCWFDGVVELRNHANATTKEQKSYYAGGIIGQVVNSNIVCTMTDCLNTGSITGGINHLGGLCGYVADAGTLNIENSMNVGEVSGDYSDRICSIVGFVEGEIKTNGADQRSYLNLQNVYSLSGVAQNNTFDQDYSYDSNGYYYWSQSTGKVYGYITGVVTVLDKQQLTGNDATINASELFTKNIWKVVAGDTPILNFTWANE